MSVFINFKKGFTLIELLIVIAVIGVISTVIMVAIDPMTQIARGRDAKRKQDISAIARAIESYYVFNSKYPGESQSCDLSIGTGPDSGSPNWTCPGGSFTILPDWASNSDLQRLIEGGYLKKLPIDPVNNSTYNYRYEPDWRITENCPKNEQTSPCHFTIGGRLEKPSDIAKPYFRCTDKFVPQCAEVAGFFN